MPASLPITDKSSKVAQITLAFWIIKILTTTVGDLSGDLLSLTLGLGYYLALAVALGVMGIGLGVQLGTKRSHDVLFWALMLVSSTVGAEVSDSMDRALHWGTLGGTGVLVGCLIATLLIWRLGRGAIGTYPVSERTDLLFYWLAALFANSLGSAIGDLVSDHFGLGFIGGVIVNFALLAVLTLLYYTTRANRAALYWSAFVFSRISF